MTDDLFDFYSPEYHYDPYGMYRRVREQDPVHWGLPILPGAVGSWHLTRYADVMQVIKDQRFVHEIQRYDDGPRVGLTDMPEAVQLYLQLSGQSLLSRDPPEHTRLRHLVNKAFTPRMIERLRPRMTALAETLLDEALAHDAVDLINDYALPLTIIGEMLGVPVADREQLRVWSQALVRGLDCRKTVDVYDRASEVALEVYAFFLELMAARGTEPHDDILGSLMLAHEAEDQLSESEVIVTATLLLVAGHETTVNLIGNGTWALLQHPAQLARLRANPALLPGAIEEFLRYEPSSQMASRYASADVAIGGQAIHKGDLINLLLGAANHDPAAYDHPDELDITRSDNRHLAFGMGIHYCLGAPLARLEAQIAFETLLRRTATIHLLEATPQWRDLISFRGLQRLPVQLTPATTASR
jgi:cytochrome P450